MLRCITDENRTIIATNCDEEEVRKLTKENKLLCPNCKSKVILKAGKVKSAHFAHFQSECVVKNYEPETEAHLTGKQILYEWLKSKYPKSDIEYEVYIPETNQIADILVEHLQGELEGIKWAFEFQHSSINSVDWEKRHELYKSSNIQDFWVLDKAKFMKFSKAKDITDARKRNELEKNIYNKVGLCYFLDLETGELTIDFKFNTTIQTTMVRGIRRENDYTYHMPIHHSKHLNHVKIRLNKEFHHGVLIYSEIESQMEERLSWILQKLRLEQAEREKSALLEKAKEKYLFIKNMFGLELSEVIWDFVRQNKDNFEDDVRNLSEEEFFVKNEHLFIKLQSNLSEFEILKNSGGLVEKLIVSLTYTSHLFNLTFMRKQGSYSLEEYLKLIYEKKVELVTYVYQTYEEDLEKLAKMNFKAIKRKLDKIYPSITPWKDKPKATDFAIGYGQLKTKEEADEHMRKVKEQIIYYNPLINMEDLI